MMCLRSMIAVGLRSMTTCFREAGAEEGAAGEVRDEVAVRYEVGDEAMACSGVVSKFC
jgi:hypothetical protein